MLTGMLLQEAQLQTEVYAPIDKWLQVHKDISVSFPGLGFTETFPRYVACFA